MAPPPDPAAEQLVELLRWYAEMGIEEATDDAPHDRFAASPPAPPVAGDAPPAGAARGAPLRRQAAASASPSRPVAAPPLPDAAVASARMAASAATTLEELRAALESFEGCGLKRHASRLVFAGGDPQAAVMLVGEAPGAEEDRSGAPFTGRGGRLLDRMLAAAGLDRTTVYIAHVVPWRPPGDREPTNQELAECLPFLRRQVELCDPDILVPMGKAALASLLGSPEGIGRARGRWADYDTGRRIVRVLPMLSPAYLLKQPPQKALAWRDWRSLAAAVDASGLSRQEPARPA